MSLQMTQEEREAFLANLHVGVIAIARTDGPPLAVPIWYSYEPGGDVTVLTGGDSLKSRLLASAQRFSLCAQVETPPFYAYVSVEGPVTSVGPADRETDARPMAHRYFGEEMGDMYIEGSEGDSTKFTMSPERWWTVDYSKM